MPIDIQELDAEIRRLTMIRELANDPKSREALERFVKPNGNGHKPQPPKPSANSEVSTLGLPSVPTNPPKRKYGEMAKLAYEVLSSTPQSPEQIAAEIAGKGFQFSARETPKYVIGDALRSLEVKGKAKRATERGAFGATLWTKGQEKQQ
jgi:hypothetical protein